MAQTIIEKTRRKSPMRVLVTTSTYPLDQHRYWGNFVESLNRRLEEKHVKTYTLAAKCRRAKRWDTKGLKILEFDFLLPRRYQLLGCPPGLKPNTRTFFGKIQVPLYLLSFFLHLLIATIRIKPNLIHANWAIPSGFISLIVGRLTRTPVVVTIHGADAYQGGFLKQIVKIVIEKANHVVVVSNHIKRMVLTFSYPKILTVIPNVVDVDRIRKTKTLVDKGDIRARFNLDGKDKIVLTIRRLVPEKRVRDLVESAKSVLEKYNDVVFIIGGGGPELPVLKGLVKQWMIEKHFRFPGAVTEEEKLELLAIADICVQTSVQEGLSLALLEFMAAGTIVISTSAAGQSETIKHGETGFLFPPADIAALSELLYHALSENDLSLMRENAAYYVFKRHKVEDHTQKYLAIYNRFK